MAKTQIVTISIPKPLLKIIDGKVKESKKNQLMASRSNIIVNALAEKFKEEKSCG